MERSEIEKFVDDIKRKIQLCMDQKKYDDVLGLISICAIVLFQTNIYYMDEQLEETLSIIANRLSENAEVNVSDSVNDDCLLFYDGFGFNDRGLIQIYLKALCKLKKVIYVTYAEYKNNIPDVLEIVNKNNCEAVCIVRYRTSYVEQISQLTTILKKYRPGHMFFYSVPYDVVGTTVMNMYDHVIKRYQINLTDHAFWLGSKCIDKCIEFRNYGAKISNEYRKISKDKIVMLPFYPSIHYENEFLGYPFEVRPEQKVIFSGGSLYKTFGDGNKYYEIVNHILDRYHDCIFWYAGVGDDSEIQKLAVRYPKRVYFTKERPDLYQILVNCRFYLSTYPICGGLMYQYAAVAGIVPVTLKKEKLGDESGFLINQESLNVDFENVEDLYDEIEKIMTDDAYVKERSEQLKNATITSDDFKIELENILSGTCGEKFELTYEHIDTEAFRQIYLENIKKSDINAMFINRYTIKTAICYLPVRFCLGLLRLARKKMCSIFRRLEI